MQCFRMFTAKKMIALCFVLCFLCLLIPLPASAALSNIETDIMESGSGGGTGTDEWQGYHATFEGDGYSVVIPDVDNDGLITLTDINAYADEELDGLKYAAYFISSWSFMGPNYLLYISKPLFKTQSFIFGSVETVVSSLSSMFMVIGRALCCLYFLLFLIDSATRDNFTLESFIKSFAKLVIIFVIFDQATINTIADFGVKLSDWMIDRAISGADLAAYSEIVEFIIDLKKGSFLEAIGALFQNIFFSITQLVSILVVLLVAFGRAIELTVYQAMLPLGMGSIFDGGLRSSGFRYVKKWMALYIQGGVMIVIMILAHAISSSFRSATIINNALGVLYDVGFSLALASIMAKSKSIANDIMGV